MTPGIELQSDTLRCEITPALGGAIAGLKWPGVVHLRDEQLHTSAESLGLRVLQAGESMSAQMCIHVERAL